MFDELVRQARRLLSSKSNGGKQVPKLTDRLHTYKQVLFAICIALVLGYSQFRDHFDCQGVEGVDKGLDKKSLTNFCLTNGTTTITQKHPHNKNRYIPHAGLQFRTMDDNDSEVINHNYMHSLWALFILLAILSYFAQRSWAMLFDNELLQALLDLNKSRELPLAKAAQEARLYELLVGSQRRYSPTVAITALGPSSNLSSLEPAAKRNMVALTIEQMDRLDNKHDHTLDYYPNQLIYWLMSKSFSNHHLTTLKLRRHLVSHALLSTCIAISQFILPWTFIGNQYLDYGWNWLLVWLEHLQLQMSQSPDASRVNSIDYDLSARIFPTVVMCPYSRYGLVGDEHITVLCNVPINEICGKLFAVIWWFVVISIFIELYSLAFVLISSVNLSTLRWTLGHRYWPHARKQADVIASFRYKRALLLGEQSNEKSSKMDKLSKSDRLSENDSQLENDIDIYYLLYLLYLRLKSSKSKVEQVIQMTGGALCVYLDKPNQ